MHGNLDHYKTDADAKHLSVSSVQIGNVVGIISPVAVKKEAAFHKRIPHLAGTVVEISQDKRRVRVRSVI
jgi:hypothetical protein